MIIFVWLLVACNSAFQSKINPPTKTIVPELSETKTPIPAWNSLLKEFPLNKGAKWTYKEIRYEPLSANPSQIVTGTYQITETVIDTQTYPEAYIARIRRDETLLAADPGYQNNPANSPWDYWYILQDNQVFRSGSQPDPTNLQTDLFSLEYQFPLYKNASWCPNRIGKATVGETPAATNVPCAFVGKRIVESEAAYESEIGSFEQCYQMTDIINSGGVTQWFCSGVGIVAEQYDHGGSRFGFSQSLIDFSSGVP